MEMPALTSAKGHPGGWRSWLVLVVLGSLVACMNQSQGSGGAMDVTADRLIQGIYITSIMASIRPDMPFVDRDLTQDGFTYRYSTQPDKPPVELRVAAYEAVSKAEAALEKQKRLMSVGPYPTETKIGDRLLLWKSGGSPMGSLAFRRANAVIYLAGGLPLDELAELARRVDGMLVSSTASAQWRTTLELPEITSVEWPDVVYAGDEVTAPVSVRGIGPSEVHIASGNTNVITATDPSLQITYFPPAKPGVEEIVLVVSTPANLMTEKRFSVEVKQRLRQ